MKKSILSAISMMLTVLMVVMSCPLQAIAYYIPQVDQTVSTPSETEPLDLAEVEILSEDISKRGESQKHFKLSDGSFVAVQYSEPVHYSDEDGKWLDINNALIFDNANDSDDFDGYVNTANSFKAKFADSVEDALFYIEGSNGENKLSFEFIDSDINSAEATINAEAAVELDKNASLFSRNQEMIACNTVSDEIAYDEIIDDVDFNYTVTARGIKENIIINRRLDNYSFAFSVDAEELTLTKKHDGSIVATDTENNVIYTIPAPFMYDENGRFSDAVNYTLSAKTNGKYTLSIVADKEWINSSETAFPVVIDPMVNTTDNEISIDAAYVTSSDPDTNKSTEYLMNIGKKSDDNLNRIFVKMILPLTARNSVITSAQLCMYQALKPDSTYYVELHEITEEWDSSTITWNNQPEYSNNVIGCTDISEGTNSTFKSWDITRYAIENDEIGITNGFVLKASDEGVVSYSHFLSNQVVAQLRPYILVNYRSQMGIEDDYSYITYSDGSDGTAYVNNYTGNLAYVKNLVTSNSDVMPASLSLIYNSSTAHSRFSGSGIGRARLNTCAYNNIYLSDGWKLSAQQSIVPISIMDIELDCSETTYAYIYTDEDGTEHYFYQDTENTESITYIDENDLGMTLTYNETDNQYKIEYDGGYTKLFKIIRESTMNGECDNGYLISETDANGNCITYGYDTTYPDRLISITDPSGTVIQLEYNSRNHVSKVTMGSATVTLDYLIITTGSENTPNVPILLTSVSNGTNTSYFTYNNEGYLVNNGLQRITNSDTSYLHFGYLSRYYDSSEEELFVDEVRWCSGGDAGVLAAYYEYEESYATTVHYIGVDCLNSETSTSKDDIYFTYTFDNNGNLTLAYSENYDRSIVYSTDTYGYSSIELNSPEMKLTSMAQIGIINENLLGAINYTNGVKEFSYTSGVDMTVAEDYEYISAITRRVEFNDANEKLYFSKELDAGTYALSFYAKFDDETSYVLSAKNISGTVLKATEAFSSATTVKDGEWSKITLEFTLTSANAVTFELTAQSAGVIYLNGIMLGNSEEYMPATYNLLYNGGFENGLDAWTVSPADSFAITTNSDVKFGDKAVSAVGSVTEEYTVSTEYDVDSNPLYSYIISGWAKAESLKNIGNSTTFELYAKVEYSYTNAENVLVSAVKETKVPFSADTTEWQYVSGVVEMPSLEEGQTLLKIDSIEIGGRYANNANTIIFDNFALVCDTAITIDYDSNGNMTEVSVDNEDSCTYEYDEDDNLIKIIDVDGSYTEYEYTDGNLTAVYDVDTDGVRTLTEEYTYYDDDKLNTNSTDDVSSTYEYTSWGAISKQTTVRTIDDTIYTMVSEYVYSNTNKKLLSETDSLDNTVFYGYNTDMLLDFIQDAKGNQTRYTYNKNTITSKFADTDKDGIADVGEAIVNYYYDSHGKLTGISTTTTDYIITYNSANCIESVCVVGETVPLITYLYNDKYTLNTGYIYGNDVVVIFEYDSVGNLKRLVKNNDIFAAYTYDTNFNVIREEDFESGAVIESFFTDNGTLYFTKKVSEDYTIVSYAVNNEVSDNYEYVTKINDDPISYSSVYDEETGVSKYVINTNDCVVEITGDTDSFGRVENINLKGRNIEEIVCSYSYLEKNVDGEIRTTGYISSITYTYLYQEPNSPDSYISNTYSYTYDENGNITSVCDGTYTTTYVYDDLNQLKRENNQKRNKTWVYTYDLSGNILSKSEYAYTEDQLGTVMDTNVYTYSNSNWGDQLTSYNGTTIEYDDQGNPVNWHDGMVVSWDKNRIVNINHNDENSSYIYDKNGYLIKTVANGAWIDYFWENGKLIAEYYRGGEQKQYYHYDENGSPVGWQYVDENAEINFSFYYIKNQQGDILGFVDELGKMAAEYDYDAWGDLIYISSNYYGYDVAEYNSLRYRGYFYDIYSDLYIIGDSYYDPSICRFINANTNKISNTYGNLLEYNIYLYCQNNPVSNIALGYLTNNVVQEYKTYDDGFILYDVPIYCQGSLELCWAFCQIMVDHFYDKSLQFTENPIQAAIMLAISVNGENYNQPLKQELVKQSVCAWGDVSIIQLYNLLKEHGPIYAGYKRLEDPDDPSSVKGHMIVITGVNVLSGVVYINNPWGFKSAIPFYDFSNRLLKNPCLWKGEFMYAYKDWELSVLYSKLIN